MTTAPLHRIRYLERCWTCVTLAVVTMHPDRYTDDDGHGSHAFGVGAR